MSDVATRLVPKRTARLTAPTPIERPNAPIPDHRTPRLDGQRWFGDIDDGEELMGEYPWP